LFKYIEIQPTDQLRDYVECFWVMKKNESYAMLDDIIIPNGSCEIVFPSGKGYLRSKDGINFKKISEAVVIGQRDEYFLLKEFQDESVNFGVRFTPYGFEPFINHVSRITNKTEGFLNLFGELGLNLLNELSEHQLIEDKLKCLELFILRQIPKLTSVNNLIKEAVCYVNQSQGTLKVNELIDILGTSKSTLSRAFINTTGYSPKKFISICRINYLIHYFNNNSLSLTELAYHFNYSDQSHFINDFKRYTSLNPKRYFELTDILVSEVNTRQRVYSIN